MGRPVAIDDDHLFNQCNGLIGFLDQVWGDVGWELQTARTPQQLRAVFVSIEIPPYLTHLLAPFVRPTSATATAARLRRARKALGRSNEREYALTEAIRPEADRVRQTAELLQRGVSAENLPAIREAHHDRLMVYGPLRTQLDDLEVEQQKLRAQLLDEEAAYAQHELLAFIASAKYAHNPRNVACAMAGLPEMGCTQSFRRCGKWKSHLWPSPRYRAFQIIARCLRPGASKEDVIDELRQTITAMRPRNRFHTNVKRLLSENWRYLRQAVEATQTDVSVSRKVPYKVFSVFTKAPYQPRSAEEQILADRERLDKRRESAVARL